MRKEAPDAATQARAARIADLLEAAMPDVHATLTRGSDFELLVAVVLSAQCTDERVNKVTPAVFRRYPGPEAMAGANLHELGRLIRPCGLHRSKARNLRDASRLLVARHGGRVPRTRAELVELPGVGNKSAGVVTLHLGGERAFPVDTHIARVAGRMGLTSAGNPDAIERDLRALFPEERWFKGHLLFVWQGRRVCHARSPGCGRCPVAGLCPRIGTRQAGTSAPYAKGLGARP